MLQVYDADLVLLTALRSQFDGQLGGDAVQLFHIRNSDALKYFTNISLVYVPGVTNADGVWSDTGWSIKYLYGTRRPTELEWDSISSAQSVVIPDIGDTNAGDDSTYHPVWLRVYCPGNLDAHRRLGHTLKISYQDRVVGA
jgi:hypothetical protein